MTEEPYLQKKKKVEGIPISKPSFEPQLQRKKRSESSSPNHNTMEPALQRKKKPLPHKKTALMATESSSQGHQYDDYVLLGDQSKFNDNIKYHVRSRSAHGHSPDGRPKSASEQASHHHHHKSSHHRGSSGDHGIHHHNSEAERPIVAHVTNHSERKSRSEERGPPPKVSVDTGKMKKMERIHEGLKDHTTALQLENDHEAFERSSDDHRKGILRKTTATQSTPRLANGIESNIGHENRQKLDEKEKVSSSVAISSEATKNLHNPLKPINNYTGKNDSNKIIVDKNIRKEENGHNTSSKADVIERGPNHAMKYRLGIAPHLSNGPVRFSEYQREYRWRDPTKASPLINAETVVYKSHPDLTLFHSSSMAEDSEYRTQFRAWMPLKKKETDESETHTERPAKHKIRRSKSMKELPTQPKPSVSTVAPAAAAAGVVVHSEEEGREHRSLEGRPRKIYRSEYSSSFLAPWNYLYEEGEWKRVHAKRDVDHEIQKEHLPSTADWYAEVLELRRFADEYRKRAQGTHFSREHLAQLYAKNAELWDATSSGRMSSRPADDQERSEMLASKSKKSTLAKTSSKPRTDLEMEIDEDKMSSGSLTPGGSISSSVEDKENGLPAQSKKLSSHRAKHTKHNAHGAHSERYQPNNAAEDSSNSEREDSFNVGHQAISNGQNSKTVIVKKKPGVNKSTKSSHEKAQKKQSETSLSHGSRGHLKTTVMSHGVPTKDSHVLVNTNSQSDCRDFGTAGSPPPLLAFEDKAIQIGDDDLMSVASFQSLASSSSLASEVLERARNRRNHFWK